MGRQEMNEGFRVLKEFACEAIHEPGMPIADPKNQGRNAGMHVVEELVLAVDSKSKERQSVLDYAGDSVAILAILATDIVDASHLANDIKAGELKRLIESYLTQGREVAEKFNGCLVKSTGDANLIVFHNPVAALEAAFALSREPGDDRLRSHTRTGIHVGTVQVTAEDVLGNAVACAVRVMEICGSGEVRVSSTAREQLLNCEPDDRLEWKRKRILARELTDGLVWQVTQRSDATP